MEVSGRGCYCLVIVRTGRYIFSWKYDQRSQIIDQS